MKSELGHASNIGNLQCLGEGENKYIKVSSALGARTNLQCPRRPENI